MFKHSESLIWPRPREVQMILGAPEVQMILGALVCRWILTALKQPLQHPSFQATLIRSSKFQREISKQSKLMITLSKVAETELLLVCIFLFKKKNVVPKKTQGSSHQHRYQVILQLGQIRRTDLVFLPWLEFARPYGF